MFYATQNVEKSKQITDMAKQFSVAEGEALYLIGECVVLGKDGCQPSNSICLAVGPTDDINWSEVQDAVLDKLEPKCIIEICISAEWLGCTEDESHVFFEAAAKVLSAKGFDSCVPQNGRIFCNRWNGAQWAYHTFGVGTMDPDFTEAAMVAIDAASEAGNKAMWEAMTERKALEVKLSASDAAEEARLNLEAGKQLP